MNRVYKIVWSKAKNAYVVTSELAKNHTKNASGKMVKAALAAAMGMGVLMGGYMADAAPATNPSGDGPGIAIGTGSSSQRWILLLSAKMRKRPVKVRWQWAVIIWRALMVPWPSVMIIKRWPAVHWL